MAANQSPMFTTGEPEKYGDYGSNPQQMDYFQKILQAGMKRTTGGRSRDRDREFQSTHYFKLQKPISKDAAGRKNKKKKRTRCLWWWWWKSAAGLRFWKWARTKEERTNPRARSTTPVTGGRRLGPLYLTESSGGARTSCRRRTGGGLLVAAEVGKVELPPYLSLRDAGAPPSRTAASPTIPVYFVS